MSGPGLKRSAVLPWIMANMVGVAKWAYKRLPYRRSGRKMGNNDPCPCASGRKWKDCHGNPRAARAQLQMRAKNLAKAQTFVLANKARTGVRIKVEPVEPTKPIEESTNER